MKEIWVQLLLFAVGGVMIVKGGGWFVDAASALAKALHVQTFIIGATIVSIATTLPELIVSVLAAAEGKIDMAVGNAVGSVTANTGLIMGIAMVAMQIFCPRKDYWKQILLLIASAVVLSLSCLGGTLSIGGSVVLAVLFLAFFAQMVRTAREKEDSETQARPQGREIARHIVLFLVGAAALVGGSQLLVRSGSALAVRLGVPDRVVAVTLVAIGTSLPELVTTLTAIAKRESSLSIGNILGANLIDLSLVLPLCAVVSGQRLPVTRSILTVDLPVCLGVTLLAMVPLVVREKSSKVQGAALLVCYAAYLVLVIL